MFPADVEAHVTERQLTRWAVILKRRRERERKETAAAIALALGGK